MPCMSVLCLLHLHYAHLALPVSEDAFPPFSSILYPSNLRAVSDKPSDHFHQVSSVMESRYKRWMNTNMIEDYC